MNKIVCCTSHGSVGCSFLDWSINYLSGATTFLSYEQGKKINLVDNPLTSTNAHRHKKNHPSGYVETKQYIEYLKSLCCNHNDIIFIYPQALRGANVLKKLALDIQNITPENLIQINQHIAEDFESMMQYLDHQGADIIFLSVDSDIPLYFMTPRSFMNVKQFEDCENFIKSPSELTDHHNKIFFKNSVHKWNELGLTNIWDQRERMAIDHRPFNKIGAHMPQQLSVTNLKINCTEFWYNGDTVIKKIMNWLNLDIDQLRFSQWKLIFNTWQKIQLDALEFQLRYKDIVDAVVSGKSMHINLTFEQEIVIQHCLIYQHNLNLKTWNLTKFPDNTLKLHKLLEANIHPVEDIYNYRSTS
jgi:hypothetical protein